MSSLSRRHFDRGHAQQKLQRCRPAIMDWSEATMEMQHDQIRTEV